MFAQLNIVAHSHDCCCRGKTRSVAYSVSVYVALFIEYAKRMRRIVICGLSSCTIFFRIISYLPRISVKFNEGKFCVLISSTTFV